MIFLKVACLEFGSEGGLFRGDGELASELGERVDLEFA